jgi:hypothetical protein
MLRSWYVPRALGEPGTSTAGRHGWPLGAAVATAISVLALTACGGGGERQDADEPEGEFPVAVTTAQFPNRQRLAETTDLRLGVENTGTEQIPELAITIFVDDGSGAVSSGAGGQGSFDVRSDQPGLANPNRPVWILEDKYPRIEGESEPLGSSPGTTAQTNTFAFGALAPGETRDMVWRLTAVRGGTYTVNYEIAAGLQGKAEAVTADGSAPEGEFVVTISTRPPKASVNDAGQVVTQD